MSSLNTVVFDRNTISIAEVMRLAEGKTRSLISEDPAFIACIQQGADYIQALVEEGAVIYGVTTGFGDSCTTSIPAELVAELPHHLYRYHGCGLGQYFSVEHTKAIMAVRIVSLAKGYSGIRPVVLHQINALLTAGITPLIPSEGSVGASGDLTPLSYLAAALCGESQVRFGQSSTSAMEALESIGLAPLQLRPKEALALMNGTSVMTALACAAYVRAEYLLALSTRITAMASYALDGNAYHFDQTLFELKPHAGQQLVASWLRQDLYLDGNINHNRLQDRYSIRCAPHILGVLADALPWFKQTIENEINSVNDNPLIDAVNKTVMHGGHFYGGHIAFVMDSMKNLIANIADMLDRQLALLVDTRYNNGLPVNLSASTPDRSAVNHGLKALQISVSAWTAEALKLTMPASVFSRSTECHNQDKVSMGTIAARDCLRILELTEQVAAAMLIAVHQAVYLRTQTAGCAPMLQPLQAMMASLGQQLEIVREDRALQPDLEQLIKLIQMRYWTLYA